MGRKKASGGDELAGGPGASPGERGNVTKAEAVRRALGEALKDRQEVQAYVKEKFGHEMTLQHISNYMSVIKRKGGRRTKRPRQALKPDAVSQAPARGLSDVLGSLKTIKGLVQEHGADTVRKMIDLVS